MSTPPGPQDPYGEQPGSEPTPPVYGSQPPAYGSQPPVYGSQPPSYGGSPTDGYGATPPPPNYLVWAIVSTVLCCLPLGIASIVFSTQVNSKWAVGDTAGALDASRKARQFAIWGAIAGAVVAVLYLIFFVLLARTSTSS
jgi:hypothetical protein